MAAPTTLFASKLIRRSPPSQFFNFFSNNYYHRSIFTSIHRRHDYLYPPSSSVPVPRSVSSCNGVFVYRKFSTHPDFSHSDDPVLPVRVLISLLDGYHDLTSIPWWIIISTSTLAMRLSLFPFVVLQLKKLKTIGELLPKLPPPWPPPLSGRSFRDQFALFWKEKEAAGCPSMFWFFASSVVQAPCFFLWILSIRRMSLDHHPGFDCGGILWFQNLTEYPHGILGPIFPVLIAGLHLTNVQISFKKLSLQQMSGPLELTAKGYKFYLQLLTLPILFITFNVPQGSLVYWLTNSSLTLIQQICLKNPSVLQYLGLPTKNSSVAAPINKQSGNSGVANIFVSTKQGKISAENLSSKEMVAFSVKVLAEGHKDTAVILLRLALEKDPGNVRALLIMGQTLLQKQQLVEASEYLERAVSKLLVAGHPTAVEEVDLLILSSQWAGSAYVRQGKMDEGLLHLERLAQLKEPEDGKAKAHYYDGLIILASALLNTGRKAEALKHLRKAVAYNPAYHVYLKQCEDDAADDFVSDLGKRDF